MFQTKMSHTLRQLKKEYFITLLTLIIKVPWGTSYVLWTFKEQQKWSHVVFTKKTMTNLWEREHPWWHNNSKMMSQHASISTLILHPVSITSNNRLKQANCAIYIQPDPSWTGNQTNGHFLHHHNRIWAQTRLDRP